MYEYIIQSKQASIKPVPANVMHTSCAPPVAHCHPQTVRYSRKLVIESTEHRYVLGSFSKPLITHHNNIRQDTQRPNDNNCRDTNPAAREKHGLSSSTLIRRAPGETQPAAPTGVASYRSGQRFLLSISAKNGACLSSSCLKKTPSPFLERFLISPSAQISVHRRAKKKLRQSRNGRGLVASPDNNALTNIYGLLSASMPIAQDRVECHGLISMSHGLRTAQA
ncbi:hypothetical protein J3F84DRAFT_386006 [Trichoderma pleuroticola]